MPLLECISDSFNLHMNYWNISLYYKFIRQPKRNVLLPTDSIGVRIRLVSINYFRYGCRDGSAETRAKSRDQPRALDDVSDCAGLNESRCARRFGFASRAFVLRVYGSEGSKRAVSARG
jgi:hypothetical protein